MMSKKIKKLLIIVLTLNILLILGYVFLFIQIKTKTEMSVNIIEELKDSVGKEKNLQFLKDVLKETEGERSKIDSYFVKDEDIVDFIEEVELIGKRAGIILDLKTVSIEGEVEKTLKLNFYTEGTFDDTFYFLTLIESMPRRVEFTGASLSKFEEKDVWEGRFDMELLSFTAK